MLNAQITSLPSNILNNINYLKQDYLGLNPNFDFLVNFTFGFIISISFLIISLLIGQKIRSLFFINADLKDINYLVDIALGTIAIGTGVALLGFFSLLNTPALLSYLILLVIISFYRFKPAYLKNVKKSLLLNLRLLKKNKFVFLWITLFIILALVNLINPEAREDQYHVDLPKMYLAKQSIMIPPREQIQVSASPLLSEMSYLMGVFLWSGESARYIHFLFYLLAILTLFEFSKIKGYKFAVYAPLLFATAPVVIHEASSMYVDFQWIFYFLLSIFIITFNKKLNYSNLALAGLFLGGMVATKLWTIVFIPISVLYLIILLKNNSVNKILKSCFVYVAMTLSVSLIWFLRAFLLTGNPLYPAFDNSSGISISLSSVIGFNYPLLNPISYINVFSPLFFIGSIFLLYRLRSNIKIFWNNKLFIFFLLLLALYLSIHYPFGRYLLGLYVFFIIFASMGIYRLINISRLSRIFLNILLLLLFLYYLINSLLVLPYSLELADKNRHLTRILSRDNSSYYDFNRQFNKHISRNDYVATYGIFGYYYANFRYIDFNFIFDSKNRSFDLYKKSGVTKLFIKGGDINWFCLKENINDCDKSKYSYVSTYMGTQPYYLYNIK